MVTERLHTIMRFLSRALAFSSPFLLAAQPAGLERFETSVRPVLARICQGCHGAKTEHAGLRLDSRAAILRGGAHGPAIVPGDPAASLLVKAIRHEGPKMPPGAKLKPEEIDAIETWIGEGAPWPAESAAPQSKSVVERARDAWAFQPVANPTPPVVANRAWVRTPVDAFILRRLEQAKLAPAEPADRRTLLRRLTFDLTGLPPKPEELESFANDTRPEAYSDAVERLLRSQRFGEHWARHWMDLVRYSESHGSQGDFDLPLAWRYRDYLIRALNSDVPYDQLIREHLAGDLLPRPRIDAKGSVNESILGTAHLRMVEYGYVPVDALDDQVKVVDNQIDVLSKAFQGLTVSCARCHDHKFDPITQKDFYALYGILASTRPGQVTIDARDRIDIHRAELGELRGKIRAELARAWLDAKPDLSRELPPRQGAAPKKGEEPSYGPLQLWRDLKDLSVHTFREAWPRAAGMPRKAAGHGEIRRVWDLRGKDYAAWFRHGNGLPDGPSAAGEFFVHPEGPRLINGIYPAGVYSHLISRKHSAVLQSPRFVVESDSISICVLGGNVAWARLVVENYALGAGGIYPAANLTNDTMHWIRFDTAYRKGSHAYIELATFDDRPRAFGGSPAELEQKPTDGRSHFGIAEVVFHDGAKPPVENSPPAALLFDGPAPDSPAQLAARYMAVLRECIAAWRDGRLTGAQAEYLDFFVRNGWLPNTLKDVPSVAPLIERYRRLEAEIPVPLRSPGAMTGTAFDQPLFVRGNHNSPGPAVPRRYLEALGGQRCDAPSSGRLELAHAIANPKNPLTARVMVNRVWGRLFGAGLVATVDNFGKNGERPSHPELLDYLATRFVEQGWSIKSAIRLMVTSNVYQLSSRGPAETAVLLQHARTRRLPAESLRDSILATSGDLDLSMYGPGIDVYYSGKTEGGGKVGPLDGARRRGVYQRIKRNAQNPFLEAFDSPKPTSTRGQRDATNVPAQSLTLMNDAFVVDQASKWADRIAADGSVSVKDRVERMLYRALGRRPSAEEIASAADYVAQCAAPGSNPMSDRGAWKDLAHSIFNFKEFLYLR